jgi:membrane-associated phospholipid phosphatase
MATGLDGEFVRPTGRVSTGLWANPAGTAGRTASIFGRIPSAIRFAFAEHRIAINIIIAQLIVSCVLCDAAGRPVIVGLGDAVITIWGAALIYGAMALAVALIRRRPRAATVGVGYSIAWSRLRDEKLCMSWLASVLVMLLVLPVSLDVFSAAKRAIPTVHPFSWDARLDAVNLWIHFGHRPWDLLQPIFGRPWITSLADNYYHLGWSFFILGAQGLAIVAAPSELRRRYLTATILVWFVVGTLGALFFSSAGPTYYGHVVAGPNPYAGLLAYLDSVDRVTPLLSRMGQRSLWAVYTNGVNRFGFGVSAMPSVHIATATLLACLCFSIRRWLGVVATFGAVLMLVSSVILGWHYAVDGYVGALLSIGLWWVAGRLESARRAE